METPKTLSSNVVFSGRVFSLEQKELLLPSGRKATREVIRHPGSAVIVPQLDEKTVLLIKQYRFALERFILEFPAGTLEPNEEPLACAKREIAEETGYGANEWLDLGDIYPAPGVCDELQHLYLAKDLFPNKAEGDEDEVIEVVEMSVSQVENAIATNQIIDGKTVGAFARARLKGLF